MPTSRKFPTPFIISASGTHTHTLILLHGRGDSGPSFGSKIYTAQPSSGFHLPALYPELKFIFPTTVTRFSTVFRFHMQQWFDARSLKHPESQNELQKEGLREAVIYIHSLIRAEIQDGIPEDRIILGGISQGCATALHVLLCYEKKLGGFIGMSGWLPFASKIRNICGLSSINSGDDGEGEGVISGEPANEKQPIHDASAQRSRHIEALHFVKENLSLQQPHCSQSDEDCLQVLRTPVFVGHGDEDHTVDYRLGRIIYSTLRDGLSMDVSWARYAGWGHWYKEPDEIDDIVNFLGEKCGLLPS